MLSNRSEKADWVANALSVFPEAIQDDIVVRMIEAERLKRDAFAQLRAATRLKEMGFTILAGNGREGVFKAQHGTESPVWVVSCSIARHLACSSSSESLEERLEQLRFAKKRAINFCAKKVPEGEQVMICMSIDPGTYNLSQEHLESSLFKQSGRYPIIAGKLSKRLTGVLVSYGNPEEEVAEWVFYRPGKVN